MCAGILRYRTALNLNFPSMFSLSVIYLERFSREPYDDLQ